MFENDKPFFVDYPKLRRDSGVWVITIPVRAMRTTNLKKGDRIKIEGYLIRDETREVKTAIAQMYEKLGLGEPQLSEGSRGQESPQIGE